MPGTLWSMDNEQLGARVAQIRGRMTQAQLATAMKQRGWKWSQTTVGNIEQGKRPLKVSELVSLAEIFDVTLYSLLEEPPKTELGKRVHRDNLRLMEASDELISRLREWFRVRESILDPESASPDEIEELGRQYWEYRTDYNSTYAFNTLVTAAAATLASEHFPDADLAGKELYYGNGEWPGVRNFVLSHTGYEIYHDADSEEG